MNEFGTPDETTTDEQLLDLLDDTLRNGSNPTRANLAFDLLCDRLGFDRRALPGYLADMKKLEEEDAADLMNDLCLCAHRRKEHITRSSEPRCFSGGCHCLGFTLVRSTT